jgi:hypothetical protein
MTTVIVIAVIIALLAGRHAGHAHALRPEIRTAYADFGS